MKAWKWRLGMKLFNLGIKLRFIWLMGIGDRLRRSGLGEFV